MQTLENSVQTGTCLPGSRVYLVGDHLWRRHQCFLIGLAACSSLGCAVLGLMPYGHPLAPILHSGAELNEVKS